MEVDLNLYTDPKVYVFSGRKRGRAVRKNVQLDQKEGNAHEVIIIIPKHTLFLNPSFLLGLVGKSIRKFGVVDFSRKFKFINDDNHKENIEEAKKRALYESDVLDEHSDD